MSLNMVPKNGVTTFFNKIADLQFSSSMNCECLNILKGQCQPALPPSAAFYWEEGARRVHEERKKRDREEKTGQTDMKVGKSCKNRRD